MVEQLRLINASAQVSYELVSEQNKARFESIFASLNNGLDEWLSLARAKDEGENTDPLTLKLLIEVLRKLENIENLLQSKAQRQNLDLANSNLAVSLGYEGFAFDEACLKSGELYFAKVLIQGFVKKHIGLYFIALDDKTAKITRLSKSDEKEWAQNVARAELSAIRASKDNG